MMKKTIAILTSVSLLVAVAIYFKGGSAPRDLEESEDRSPAAAFDSLKQQSDVDKITAIVLSVKSRTDVNTALKKISEITNSEEAKRFPAVQMMGAVADLIPTFEGIIWRCRTFIEPADFLHMSALFKLRGMAYNDYLYGPHLRALFDYVTYPSITQGPAFERVDNLQDYFHEKVGKKLRNILAGASVMEALSSHAFEFNFDRTLLVGQRDNIRFIDPDDAKKKFTKSDFFTLEFLLQRALMTIDYVASIELDYLPQIASAVIKETTINEFKGTLRPENNLAKGITPQMVYDEIKKTENFLDFRTGTEAWLAESFQYGKISAKYELAAYVCGIRYPMYEQANGRAPKVDVEHCQSLPEAYDKDRPFVKSGDEYLFDPNHLLMDFKHKYHALRDRARAFEESEKNGSSTVTSDVTGKSIAVNIKALFNPANSPRNFLPDAYRLGVSDSVTLANGKSTKSWNYDYGKPMHYTDYTFGGFFTGKDRPHDIKSLYDSMTNVLYTDSIAPFAVFIRIPSTARAMIPMREIVRDN